MNKRFAFKLAFAGAAALALTACGEKTEPPKAAEPAKTAAAPAAAKEPLKVAFMYVSPANEEGWSTQHDIARRAVEAKFGDKIKVTTVENIPKMRMPSACCVIWLNRAISSSSPLRLAT